MYNTKTSINLQAKSGLILEEDSKTIAKMLTNQVYNLNKEQNDKRDVPIDEELYKGTYELICILLHFGI